MARLVSDALRLRDKGLAMVDRQYDIVAEAGCIFVENVIAGGAYSPGTPVDTGAARGSWGVFSEGGEPNPFDKNHTDKGGAATVARACARIRELLGKLHRPVRMATNCEYMIELENGHSQKAPNGMLRSALAHWVDMLQEGARRVQKGAR